VSERQERAFYLSLAAVLGDGIYNFGELLMHPILGSLNGTRDQWLVDLLFAFNRGDLEKFETLKNLWTSQADLKAAEFKMRQKICLLCLMEVSNYLFNWIYRATFQI
jgi:26S proteasome regulatory subunit N9